jgi:hypothetical protein
MYNRRMAQNRETREVQNPSILEVGCRSDVLVWRNVVGLFRAYDQPRRVLQVGTPGMPDSMMAVAVTITPDMVGKTVAVAVAPEFKTKRGTQQGNQADWQAAFESRGGVYRLVRSPAEMVQLVEDVQSGAAF